MSNRPYEASEWKTLTCSGRQAQREEPGRELSSPGLLRELLRIVLLLLEDQKYPTVIRSHPDSIEKLLQLLSLKDSSSLKLLLRLLRQAGKEDPHWSYLAQSDGMGVLIARLDDPQTDTGTKEEIVAFLFDLLISSGASPHDETQEGDTKGPWIHKISFAMPSWKRIFGVSFFFLFSSDSFETDSLVNVRNALDDRCKGYCLRDSFSSAEE